MNKQILKHALISSLATTAYVVFVVQVIGFMEEFFRGDSPDENLLLPAAMLLTFVISAAITSLSVFGQTIMWFLEGKKKESMHLIASTLMFLVIFAIIIVVSVSAI